MKKTIFILMIVTIASKFFGFIRDVYLSYFFGTSNVSDIYLISVTIPMVIFSFIAIGISTGYIPMYSRIEQNYGLNEGNRFTNNLINILLVLCTVIIFLGILFTSQLVKIFASGFIGETLVTATLYTRIGLVGIYFTGLVSIFSGLLQIKGNHVIPAIVVFPMNLVIIVSIFLGSRINPILLPIGTVIATASQLLIIVPYILKKGYKYEFILNLKDSHIKDMLCIVFPVIIGVSVNQINTLVDRTLASKILVGGISALNYAARINWFALGIVVSSISTVLYPTISKMAVAGDTRGFKKAITQAIVIIALLIIPATIGIMSFSTQIVSLLFGRGAFDDNAITITSYALFYYSLGMIGFGLNEILSRVFYSMQDTKTPMINATIGVSINIVLNFLLSKYMGIGGLALATSIASILTSIFMAISLTKRVDSFDTKKIITSLIKILFSSLVMGTLSRIFFNYLINNFFSQNIALVLSIAFGVLVYFITITFMQIEDVEILLNYMKSRMKKGFSRG